MKAEEIDNLSCEAAKDKLRTIFMREAIVNMYFATEELMTKVSDQMLNFNLDLAGDEAKDSFTIIDKYMTNATKYAKHQEELRKMIDEDILKAAKEKRLAAKSKTLEDFVNNRKKK